MKLEKEEKINSVEERHRGAKSNRKFQWFMWGMEAGEGRKDQEQAQLMHLKFILKIKIYPENQAIKRLSNK